MGESGDVQLDRFYSGTNTFWVEPTTGAPVRQEQQRHEVLKSQDGIERAKAFVADAKMTDKTVQELVDSAIGGQEPGRPDQDHDPARPADRGRGHARRGRLDVPA